MSTKSVSLILLLSLVSANAVAADWIELAREGSGRLYVDRNTAAYVDDFISVWTKYVGHGKIMITQSEISCRYNTIFPSRELVFNKKGKLVSNETYPTRFLHPVPGTTGEVIVNYMCMVKYITEHSDRQQTVQ